MVPFAARLQESRSSDRSGFLSDDIQIIAAIDCAADESNRYGEAVLGWLVEHDIVEPKPVQSISPGRRGCLLPGPELMDYREW